jgi:DNA helicase-2/ATP-dependent DNA helicase PcrA
VAELLKEMLSETGYLEALEAERTIEAQGRIENLEELVNVAAEYDAADSERDPGERSLADFLQQVSLRSDADERTDDQGLVTLMTLHNAKGLEFGIVFMIGCEEGVFPHSRALDEGGLEEERRLCYVGITRAQRDLYMCWARTRAVFGARQFGLPSRFIGEIPAGLTDREEQEAAIRRFRSGAGATISRGVAGLRARATTWDRSGGDGGGWHDPAAPAPAAYRLGEDVVHPTFGEGVVTGIEPGGIVVIRFSRDRLERKLVADLAPINRR